MFFMRGLRSIAGNEAGISSVEYALILGLVGLAIVAAAMGLGDAVVDRTNEAANFFKSCNKAASDLKEP